MPSLSPRERGIVGLGLAAATMVVLFLQAVDPLLTRHRKTGELTVTREATLERRRGLIAQRGRLIAERDTIAKRLAARSGRLLPGSTAALAASELQKLMKEAATVANVEVRSERVLPAVELGGLLEVPIELTVAGTIRETVGLLSQLEQAPRLLTVKDVKIRVAAPGQPRDLLTTLTVSGYLRPA
jgi:type II secretory pathway component PulM